MMCMSSNWSYHHTLNHQLQAMTLDLISGDDETMVSTGHEGVTPDDDVLMTEVVLDSVAEHEEDTEEGG